MNKLVAITIEETLQAMTLYEGFTIEEAKLTYKAREKLPNSAFCGPNRTYPAHNAAHVGSAFQRLSQFGHKLPQSVRARIISCLNRRAKRFGVKHDAKNYKWKGDGSPNTKVQETAPSKISWYLDQLGIK